MGVGCFTDALAITAAPYLSIARRVMRLDEAAPIALETTAAHLERHPGVFAEVRFVLFDARALAAFSAALAGLG